MSKPRSDFHSAHWQFVAWACAERAYATREESRRGVIHVAEEDILAFYDNTLPNGSMRERERIAGLFRGYLAEAGIRVLAEATHPRSGPDDGHTLALVLDAGADEGNAVVAAWDRVCRECPFK